MSTSRHTPGPWTTDADGVIRGRDGLIRPYVCEVADDHNDGETKANALLIASAPELLDVCAWAADILMCDIDNDDPCTAHPEREGDERDCNPCHVRRELWLTIAKAKGGAV